MSSSAVRFSEHAFNFLEKFCHDFHASFMALRVERMTGKENAHKMKETRRMNRDAQLVEDFMRNPQGIGVLMLCSVIIFLACVLTLTYGGVRYIKIVGGVVAGVLLGFHIITRNPALKSHCF